MKVTPFFANHKKWKVPGKRKWIFGCFSLQRLSHIIM
jgi:hypothetical protein